MQIAQTEADGLREELAGALRVKARLEADLQESEGEVRQLPDDIIITSSMPRVQANAQGHLKNACPHQQGRLLGQPAFQLHASYGLILSHIHPNSTRVEVSRNPEMIPEGG